MSEQLAQWTGSFGEQYTRRNVIDWRTRAEALTRLIPTDVNDVLEVGCNRGHNLVAIQQAMGDRIVVRGIEPAEYPRTIAQSLGLGVLEGNIYAILYEDDDFDLCFTSGVLIHCPPDLLDTALREMTRVARRYIIAIEYFAEQDTEVEYRGEPAMLWKRDYGAHYLRACPSLRLIGMGDDAAGFDGARYWLLEKK